jgi:hypothetical protein
LQVSPPVHEVPHLPDVHALPTGQSPAAPHPQLPPTWQTCPELCVEQSVQTPPPMPHRVPPAAPVTQLPVVVSQQPVLHVNVEPMTTQSPHLCVETSHA